MRITEATRSNTITKIYFNDNYACAMRLHYSSFKSTSLSIMRLMYGFLVLSESTVLWVFFYYAKYDGHRCWLKHFIHMLLQIYFDIDTNI